MNFLFLVYLPPERACLNLILGVFSVGVPVTVAFCQIVPQGLTALTKVGTVGVLGVAVMFSCSASGQQGRDMLLDGYQCSKFTLSHCLSLSGLP